MKIISDAGIENLRYAIVKQAVIDYDKSLKELRKHTPPKTEDDEKTLIKYARIKSECESFFHSKWFSMLFDIDGDMIMRQIRQRYYNRPLRWGKED